MNTDAGGALLIWVLVMWFSPKIAGALEFRGVTFGYNRGEAPLIDDFSLTVADAEHPVTRGLHVAFGARRETLVGLSGLGDLVLTCTGERLKPSTEMPSTT